jgi:hypothetical protein
MPVLEHAPWADHQDVVLWRAGTAQAEQPHYLVGLAEPHIVGEQCADPRLITVPEPADTVALIGP